MDTCEPLFFTGVALTEVVVWATTTIGSALIWAGLTRFVFRARGPTARWGTATAMAVLVRTLLVGTGGEVTVDPIGILLALEATASKDLSNGREEPPSGDTLPRREDCGLRPRFCLVIPEANQIISEALTNLA